MISCLEWLSGFLPSFKATTPSHTDSWSIWLPMKAWRSQVSPVPNISHGLFLHYFSIAARKHCGVEEKAWLWTQDLSVEQEVVGSHFHVSKQIGERRHNPAYLSPFSSVWGRRLWNSAFSVFSWPSWEVCSRIYPEVCLLGNSKSILVDNEDWALRLECLRH